MIFKYLKGYAHDQFKVGERFNHIELLGKRMLI